MSQKFFAAIESKSKVQKRSVSLRGRKQSFLAIETAVSIIAFIKHKLQSILELFFIKIKISNYNKKKF